MADTPSVEKIQKDLEDLKCHIKTYSTGAYPAFFLQLHSVLKIQDILDMELADVYFCEEGQIKLLPEIIYAGEKIILDAEERKELAWYAMQRIPVCDTQEEVLNDWLCVNKQGKQLQMTFKERAETGIWSDCCHRTFHPTSTALYGSKPCAQTGRIGYRSSFNLCANHFYYSAT